MLSNKSNFKENYFKGFIKSNGSFIIFIIIFIIAFMFVPNFASKDNFFLVLKQSAIPVISCFGMTLVLMTGGIDLSLGYVVGLTSIISGMLVKTMGVPIPLAIIIVLIIGAFVGLINGLIVEKLKVPAFITTLGSGYVIYGFSQIVSQGEEVSRLPKAFLAIGNTDIFGGLNTTVLIAIFISVIMIYVFHLSVFGRELSAFGLNAKAARLSGIKTKFINIFVYVISSLLAGVSGILLTIRVNSAQPNMGGGVYTFDVITGAIIGGASLFGGVGSVVGCVFGVIITKIIANSINLAGVSYYMYQAFMGVIILIAIVFENLKNKKL